MILFNGWLLLIVICGILFIAIVASYAKAQNNFSKICKKYAILISCCLLFTCITFPKTTIWAEYNLQSISETESLTDNVESKTNVLVKIITLIQTAINKSH